MPSVLHKQFRNPVNTPEDVTKALHALSDTGAPDSDMAKLQGYAGFLALRMQGTVFYAAAKDLLHEAIARTMDGRRRWATGIDFVTHLKGAMRSIANEYKKDARLERAYSEATKGDEELTADPYANDQARETLQRIRNRVKDDRTALSVFDRLREGYSAAEIQTLLRIDEDVYNAARKKIYRRIRGLYEA